MIQAADQSLSKTQQSTSQSNKRSIDFVFFVAVNSLCAGKIGHFDFLRNSCVSAVDVGRKARPYLLWDKFLAFFSF